MSEISSLFTYLVAFSISILFVKLYQKYNGNRKIYKFVLMLGIVMPAIIIQGFRYNVGTDYMNYYNIYKGIGRRNTSFLTAYANEPLFLLENIILNKITEEPLIFFLVEAIVMNFLLFFIVKRHKDEVRLDVVYALYYFICFPIFLNIERQGIACMLVWLAFEYINEHKFFKFLLCIFLATGFHNTAVLFVVMYFFVLFDNKKFGGVVKKVVYCLLIVSPLLLSYIIKNAMKFLKVFASYSSYIKAETSTPSLMMIIFISAVAFPAWILSNKKKNDKQTYIVFLFPTIIMCYLFCVINRYIEIGYRLLYYVYYGLFLYSGRAANNSKRIINRNIYSFYFIIVAFLYFMEIFYIIGNANVIPFQFYN